MAKPRRQTLWSYTVAATGQTIEPVNLYLLPGVRYALRALHGADGFSERLLGQGRLMSDGTVTDLIPPPG